MSKMLMLLTVLVLSLTFVAPPVPRDAIAGLPADDAMSSNPPVLPNISKLPKTVEVNLTAGLAKLSLQPGVISEVFAYNGHVPGPTLDVREGDRVIIHFRNHLPEPTTVH